MKLFDTLRTIKAGNKCMPIGSFVNLLPAKFNVVTVVKYK